MKTHLLNASDIEAITGCRCLRDEEWRGLTEEDLQSPLLRVVPKVDDFYRPEPDLPATDAKETR
jgi:hypothetical protein